MSAQKTPSARQVALWARKAKEAVEARDEAIRAMRAEGASLRAIASAAGLTAMGVRKILARSQAQTEQEGGRDGQ